jgi:radical SAM superfamily enzyme
MIVDVIRKRLKKVITRIIIALPDYWKRYMSTIKSIVMVGVR